MSTKRHFAHFSYDHLDGFITSDDMLCKNCPLTLICYTGRLDRQENPIFSWDTFLCPICGKFICIDTLAEIIYAFFCEKRQLTQEIKNKWYRHYSVASVSDDGGLLVTTCDKCSTLGKRYPIDRIEEDAM